MVTGQLIENTDSIALEKVKDYWNTRPCNIRHSTQPFGTWEYFKEVEKRKYFIEPHIPIFAEFPRWKGKKVLEIGCGIGTDTMNFFGNGAHVTTVDLSEESVKITNKRFDVMFKHEPQYTKFNSYIANAEELSNTVPVEEYDLVYSFGVLHHTPHQANAFLEVKKYMGPNSEFKLMVYNKASIKVLQILDECTDDYTDSLDDIIAYSSEAQSGCPITYSYTPKQITSILENLGFEVTKVEIDHIFPYQVPKYVKYEYEVEDYWKDFTPEQFKNLEQKFGWHLLVTAKLKR